MFGYNHGRVLRLEAVLLRGLELNKRKFETWNVFGINLIFSKFNSGNSKHYFIGHFCKHKVSR